MLLSHYLSKKYHIKTTEFQDIIRKRAIFVNDIVITSEDTLIAVDDRLRINMRQGDFTQKIRSLPQLRPRLILFHKPKGYVVSKDDPHNKTIYDILPPHWRENYVYIGRLDKNSHGLQLLTNEPALVEKFAHPRNKVQKHYTVRIDKPRKSNHSTKATKGMYIDQAGLQITGEKSENKAELPVENLTFFKVKYKLEDGNNMLYITLTEGKKRHIRRVLKALGYKVMDLQRTKIGIYELGNIKSGKWRIEKVRV